MPSAWILICVLAGVGPGDVGPSDFVRLMDGLHGEVRDVSFVFEGWLRGVPPGRSIQEDMREGVSGRVGERTYQGGYAFRSDGATRLDCYIDYINDNKEFKSFSTHQVMVILDHQLSRVDELPERRDARPTVGPGGPGMLNRPFSPERICYFWFLQTLKDPASWRYQCLGWEEIGGHRCLKIQLDEGPGLPDRMADRPTVRYWIDLERGGHPLQVEFRRGDRPRMRTGDIELERLPGPGGRERWFPVHGVTYIYPVLGPGYVDRPVAYETYQVLQGTVRVNQGLPDAYFTLGWKGAIPENAALAARRKGFRKPLRRSDAQGIKQHLEEALAEADEQSRALEASSPARETWSGTSIWQVGFAAAGLIVLIGVGAWRWKFR